MLRLKLIHFSKTSLRLYFCPILRPSLGLLFWYLLILVKSLPVIWRSGTRRRNLRVFGLQICRTWQKCVGASFVAPIMVSMATLLVTSVENTVSRCQMLLTGRGLKTLGYLLQKISYNVFSWNLTSFRFKFLHTPSLSVQLAICRGDGFALIGNKPSTKPVMTNIAYMLVCRDNVLKFACGISNKNVPVNCALVPKVSRLYDKWWQFWNKWWFIEQKPGKNRVNLIKASASATDQWWSLLWQEKKSNGVHVKTD